MTSPGRTGWLAASMRKPLSRTWPLAANAVAAERVRTTRACHNHLSIRWRSRSYSLLVGFELLLQGQQLGEWRIRIGLLAAAFVRGTPGPRRTLSSRSRSRRGRSERSPRGGRSCRSRLDDHGPGAWRGRRAAHAPARRPHHPDRPADRDHGDAADGLCVRRRSLQGLHRPTALCPSAATAGVSRWRRIGRGSGCCDLDDHGTAAALAGFAAVAHASMAGRAARLRSSRVRRLLPQQTARLRILHSAQAELVSSDAAATIPQLARQTCSGLASATKNGPAATTRAPPAPIWRGTGSMSGVNAGLDSGAVASAGGVSLDASTMAGGSAFAGSIEASTRPFRPRRRP